MTREENIRAVLECVFSQSREDLIDIAVNGIMTLKDEPCDDEYIKVPKKALKYRTAGMVAYNAEWLKNHFDIERVVICGEQEPCETSTDEPMTMVYPTIFCEDAISREAVKDLFCRICMENNLCYRSKETCEDLRLFDELPSVTPSRHKGHWIDIGSGEECSVCHEIQYGYDNHRFYCGNCGAKMVEPQESEEEQCGK